MTSNEEALLHVKDPFRTFHLSRPSAARLSFVLGLGLAAAGVWCGLPAAVAQSEQASVRSDLAIQSDVLKALSSYPDISSEHITATTQDGVVTLNGSASTDTAKNQAQVVAATVDGVRSVVNHVAVSADSNATANESQTDTSQADTSGQQNDAQEPVQQAQSTDPNQQQAPYTPQSQPAPGAKGSWGQAGPPPDVQNGQIPQQGSAAPQSGQSPAPNAETPMEDPGQEPGQQPQQRAPYPQQQQQPAYGSQGGGYPPQPSYGQRAYGQQGGYAAPRLSSAPLTLPPGTLFTARTSEPLDSRRLRGGENFQLTLAQDLFQGPYLAVPRGAVLEGRVVGVKKPGAFRGDAGFALQIVSINLGGQSYPVATDTFATDTRGKGGYTTANTVGGAAIGALIGAVAGGGPGAAIGAVAGGGVGLGASAATPGPREIMPPETLLSFHLNAPVTVGPISMAEVQQLHASVTPPPRRVVRARPPYPYGYYPPPPPPPYYYPYPYRY